MNHEFTHEERVRGGRAGFRAAVFKVQCDYNLEFNDAVCWLKRKIGWRSKDEMLELSQGRHETD
jgi:hypothetical protein